MSGKYYTITEQESLLQRFMPSDLSGLNTQRKLEAEAAADNWVDRTFHEWDVSQFAISGDVPAQIAEIAELVAIAAYIRREYMVRGKDPASDDGSIVHGLMMEAGKIANQVLSIGFVLTNDGQKIFKASGDTKGDMFVGVAV